MHGLPPSLVVRMLRPLPAIDQSPRALVVQSTTPATLCHWFWPFPAAAPVRFESLRYCCRRPVPADWNATFPLHSARMVLALSPPDLRNSTPRIQGGSLVARQCYTACAQRTCRTAGCNYRCGFHPPSSFASGTDRWADSREYACRLQTACSTG